MKKYTLILVLVWLTNFVYGQGAEEEGESKTTPDLPGIILVDFGFNFLKNAPGELETNWFKSKSFGMYYMKSFKLGKKLTFNPAIGINFEKYGLTNDVTIGYGIETQGSPAVPAVLDSEGNVLTEAIAEVPNTYGDLSILDISYLDQVNKSQLAMNYLDIPIQLRYFFKDNTVKGGTYLAVGAIASILLESHTKVKFKDSGRDITEKARDDFNQSKLRYGLQGRFGFGSVNFFYKHYFSNLFGSDGPVGATEITTNTIGISISGL